MTNYKLLGIDDIEEGCCYETEILIQHSEAIQFLDLTGDHNPLHRDQSFAIKTTLGAVNLAGQQITAVCVGLIGTRMPGPGWSCLSVDSKYIKPTYENTKYFVRIECVSKSKVVGVVNWSIRVTDQARDICVSRIAVATQVIL